MSVELTTLPSGLRIVTERMPHVETASLGVWIAAGSRHESAEEHGLSHLLEHMAFKGTARRSARTIAEEIEAAGGELNAATSTESTTYYAHLLGADVPLGLDILADILTASAFDPDELAREKDVILQEIGAVEDTPDDLVFDLFHAAAYPDQAVGRPILGTAERVTSFDRETIAAYLGRHYGAGAAIVGAAGAVEHARIVAEAEARFADLPASGASPAAAARYLGGDSVLRRKLEQAHLVVGFEGLPLDHPDHYAIHIFANAVGGGMSSRLFQDVRETRGLAYSIYAFHWSYSDTGLLGFYAATSGAKLRDLTHVSLDALAAATVDLDADEIRRAKAQVKVGLLTALESPSARSEQMARQLLAFGRVLPRDEIVARIDELDVEQIRRAGARALKTRATVSAIGPVATAVRSDAVAARVR